MYPQRKPGKCGEMGFKFSTLINEGSLEELSFIEGWVPGNRRGIFLSSIFKPSGKLRKGYLRAAPLNQ